MRQGKNCFGICSSEVTKLSRREGSSELSVCLSQDNQIGIKRKPAFGCS
jgi:hypothetical protein